jgi:predicted transposase/invertase (TIGR01784 family)
MAGIKPLSEQTLMNNYVFSMVMREPRRIKPLLEHILGKKIKTIRMVEPEKTMKEKFESKGIRLDLYVEDADGVVYDVEVQTTDQKNLPRRMRYYQGMLDIIFFPAGADYNLMRKSYVIFICNFDPYGEGLYIYTFQNRCDQNYEVLFGDDAVKVVVNTKGTKGDISPELKEAIIYLDREEVTGPYSKELDDAVNELKSNEERGQEYMMLMTYGAEREAAGKYIGLVEQIRGWYNKKSILPVKDAAEYAGITIPQFEGVVALIKEHPDWDDRMVADQADWR